MKYLLICAVIFSISFIDVYSGCPKCNVPDGWVCYTSGGQEVQPPEGDCYTGYAVVASNSTTKAISCSGKGNSKCQPPPGSLFGNLHSDLINHAINEINLNNNLNGSFNINMYIDGYPMYGTVIWNTNTTTNESTINTTVN